MKIHHHTLTRFMLASSIALGVSLPASAMDKTDGCEGHTQMHGLNLSVEQKGRISDLMHARGATMRDKVKEARKARMEIGQISMSNNYDEAKVKMLSEASAKTIAEMAQIRARTEHEIYQMLTPEQRKQVEEQKMRYKSRSQEKDGGRWGERQG